MSVFRQMCEIKLCKSKMYKLEKNTKKKKEKGKKKEKSSYHLPINSETLDYVLLSKNLW